MYPGSRGSLSDLDPGSVQEVGAEYFPHERRYRPSTGKVAGDGRLERLVRRWGRLRRLDDADAAAALHEWADLLAVGRPVTLQRIDPSQVTGPTGRRGCSLVGVVADPRGARLLHTRKLTGEDLVHELLHLVHPEWNEAQVVLKTAWILGIRPCPRNLHSPACAHLRH